MFTVPVVRPVTTPDGLTVALVVLLLDQMPPAGVAETVTGVPMQTEPVVPEITEDALTVTERNV